MNVKVTENICEVENNVILNAGEYNIHEFHFFGRYRDIWASQIF